MLLARFMGISAVGLVALAASNLTACGGDDAPDLPDGAMAKVGDVLIKEPAFTEQVRIGYAYLLGRRPTYRLTDYKSCARFKIAEALPEGGFTPKRPEYVDECKDDLKQVRTDALQALVLAEWLNREVARQDVTVTPAEVREAFAEQKRREWGSEKGYRLFRQRTRIPENAFLEQARRVLLTEKLQRAKARANPPTRSEIAAFFAEHRRAYDEPERREMRAFLTETEKAGRQARKALDAGQPWPAVAKAYSIGRRVEKVPPVARGGGLGPEVESAAFNAPEGKPQGPLETGLGWYVFKVVSIRPARQGVLDTATAERIRERLHGRKRNRVLARYSQEFGARFRPRTVCADELRIPQCSNGPPPGEDDDSDPQANAAGR